MRLPEAALARIVPGHIRAAQRDDHRRAVQVEQREHRGGRQREDEVHDVVRVPREQVPHRRRGRRHVADRAADPALVRREPVARHPVHGEYPLLGRRAVPAQPRVRRSVIAAAHDVHRHATPGQSLGQRPRGQPGPAPERRIFIVEQQHAHGRHRSREEWTSADRGSVSDSGTERARGTPVSGACRSASAGAVGWLQTGGNAGLGGG